ncbi:MAG: hypothetical protein HW421_2793 [Ignavibacteria bacterium]|nr:hypothetical protein [Ignavibacteria bacterium]
MLSFLEQNSLYIVLFIVLVIQFGLGLYLYSVDGKISKLEKQAQAAHSDE